MSQRSPAASTMTFPGCGSAWKRPSTKVWDKNDCSRLSAISARERPALSITAASDTSEPLTSSMTRTRRVVISGKTSGKRIPGSVDRLARIVALLACSRVKSSSRRTLSMSSRVSPVTPICARVWLYASSLRAPHNMTRASRSTISSIPGR